MVAGVGLDRSVAARVGAVAKMGETVGCGCCCCCCRTECCEKGMGTGEEAVGAGELELECEGITVFGAVESSSVG